MKRPGTEVSYHVEVHGPEHILDVTMELSGVEAAAPLRVRIPTWVPGAYAFMRYGRNVFGITASDAESGEALTLVRVGWAGWQVTPKSGRVRLHYRAFTHDHAWGELTGLLDHRQAVLLGTLYPQLVGHDGPCSVRYRWPDGWPVHHPTGAKLRDDGAFEYPDYFTLLDTPVVAGAFDVHTRTSRGTPFHFVFLDRCVAFDEELERFLDSSMSVVEACHDVFGAYPFEAYTFVISFNPLNKWGLEHRTSTMIGLGDTALIDKKARNDAMRLIAHELFHAWNVCSLRPLEFMKPDLEHGSFTDLLWVAEGVTRYYEFLLCVRAGELEPEDLFSNVVNYHRHLTVLPAYANTSAVDSSRATFLNHHRYPGACNTTIDFYDIGMLIAFELDVALLAAGTNLDEAFGAFYRAHVATGYTQPQLLEFLAERAPAVREIFSRAIEGAGRLQPGTAFERLGFSLGIESVPCLGFTLVENKGPAVQQVLDGMPAAAAGMAPGDELVRIDGYPFALPVLKWLVTHRDRVAVTVRRGHEYFTFPLSAARRTQAGRLVFNGGTEQQALLAKWLRREGYAPAAGTQMPLTAHENFHGITDVI